MMLFFWGSIYKKIFLKILSLAQVFPEFILSLS